MQNLLRGKPYANDTVLLENTGVFSHFLSRNLAHLKWPSKLAITWPHMPRFCPGEDMMVDKSEEILGSKIQMVKFVVEIKNIFVKNTS